MFPGQLVFTLEKEENNTIVFLDLKVIRTSETFEFEFYQKPTHSGKYMDYYSHCPERTKHNIVTTETRRIMSNCSKQDFIWKHLEKLRTTTNLISSNYPPILVSKLIANEVNRQLKDGDSVQLPKQQYDFVYSV